MSSLIDLEQQGRPLGDKDDDDDFHLHHSYKISITVIHYCIYICIIMYSYFIVYWKLEDLEQQRRPLGDKDDNDDFHLHRRYQNHYSRDTLLYFYRTQVRS